MTNYGRILVAGAGSLLMLLGALGFQFLGGLAPCPLCVWQRWPHVVAVALALLAVTALWRVHRAIAGLGAFTMVVSFGIAAFHVGVEQQWWTGFEGCAAPDPGLGSVEDLLARIEATDPVRCDEIAWKLFGISMAGWNGLASLGLAAIWGWSVRPHLPQPER